MWFKRKAKNRRFERKHVLDVKLRSSQRRQHRLRRIIVVMGCLLLLAIGGFGMWRGGEWGLRGLVYENSAFAIHHLDVETDGVIAREQIRRWAGVKLEDNLFALDLERVKRDLELVPAIQGVSVERLLPHTLKIRVTEREPIARFYYPRMRLGGIAERGTCFIDAEGMVMTPLEPHQRALPLNAASDSLPVLIGIPAEDLRPGNKAEAAQMKAALRFIQEFECSPMAEVADVREIVLTSPGVLQVTTAQGSELIFGLGQASHHLRRWRAVHEYGQRAGKHVAWMDLSVSNNVPARFVDVTAAPPASRKATKPPRKRHV